MSVACLLLHSERTIGRISFVSGRDITCKEVTEPQNFPSAEYSAKKLSPITPKKLPFRNHTIFRHANFIGCLSADKIKMPVRKYFCFNIPVYRNMAEEPSCRSPYHEEYIQTSVSGNSEGLCRSTYSFLSERR